MKEKIVSEAKRPLQFYRLNKAGKFEKKDDFISKKYFRVRKTAFGVNFSLAAKKMLYLATRPQNVIGTIFFYKLG